MNISSKEGNQLIMVLQKLSMILRWAWTLKLCKNNSKKELEMVILTECSCGPELVSHS
jgi:hypothetical protein